MDNRKDIIVGCFGKPFGIKGWLHVNSFTAPKENILGYLPWQIQQREGWQTLSITESRPHGDEIVVHIEGYDTPEDAKALTQKGITIQREQLPALEEDEYYWSDLEGLAVKTVQGELLGEVDYLIESGSNDIFVVKNQDEKKERLIPYIPNDVVIQINMKRREIIVDWDPDF